MNDWQKNYHEKLISLTDAVNKIESGDKIWAGGLLSLPIPLLLELDKNLTHFQGCELYTGLMTHPFEFIKPQYKHNFKHTSLFMGPIERKMQGVGNVDIMNFHFSNFKKMMDHIKPDTVIIEVSPANEEGYVSLGACGGIGNKLALAHANKVILVVNKFQPFIGGQDNLLSVDCADYFVEADHSIASPQGAEPSDLEMKIAEHVKDYVNDGDTIQIGIGTISNAMGMALKEKQNLGIHTEMFTESMFALCCSGAVTGSQKNYKPNKIVTAFAAGSQALMDYVHNNPNIEMGCVTEVVDSYEIAKNNNFVSINTCVMVDLIGQIASEGVGFSQISGSGGQLDFVKGAGRSEGGLSILALAATRKGKSGIESNIHVALPFGTAVTTPRNDVQVIATEYGATNLSGLHTSQRVEALISIAHPDFRASLLNEAQSAGLI